VSFISATKSDEYAITRGCDVHECSSPTATTAHVHTKAVNMNCGAQLSLIVTYDAEQRNKRSMRCCWVLLGDVRSTIYKRNRVGGLPSLACVRYQPLSASQVGNAVTLDNPRPMGGASLLTRSQVSLNQGKRRSRCFRYICIYTTALFRHPNAYDSVGDMYDTAMRTCIRVSPNHWSQIVTSALADTRRAPG
jgi:hypothetical protein